MLNRAETIVQGKKPLSNCDRSSRGTQWGWIECIKFTAIDSNKEQLKNVANLTAQETVEVKYTTSTNRTKTAPSPVPLLSDGTFGDQQTATSSVGPLRQTYREILRLSITILSNGTPVGPNPIRVNCILKTANDIKILDQTLIKPRETAQMTLSFPGIDEEQKFLEERSTCNADCDATA